MNIVVLNGEGETFGLIVDEIKDTADIVVKSLSQFLKRLSVYSGATIMGDGTVSLILDISGIAQKAGLFQKASKDKQASSALEGERENKANTELQDFLFFRLNSPETYCLPLCLVNRLEEFLVSDIDISGSQRMVKYRGSILPLISLNELLKLPVVATDAPRRDKTSVVVVQKSGRFFGIEVNEVVDIQSIKSAIEDPIAETKGVLGSVIVSDEVMTVIDVLGILDSVVGSRKGPAESGETPKTAPLTGIKVLFAEDTVFFMKQVRKVLEQEGMKVVHASDGEEAWSLLSAAKPGDFQLLLSDIEMPKLTGFDLAERVRADERFAKLPLIALTTRFRDVDREKGKKVGFNRYLEKLKSDVLLQAIRELMGKKE